MKKIIIAVFVLTLGAITGSGCSTTAHLKMPAGTHLEVNGNSVYANEHGAWRTSPFFWSGADYQLKDKSGKVIQTGSLKTHFRVASLFWPPFAIIYWPKGFSSNLYDIESPDGEMVTVNQSVSTKK